MLREALDFSRRAEGPEWMDLPCSYEELRDCLRDLRAVNRITFGYRPTLNWLSRLRFGGEAHIVDVGCGSGDMLREIERWARRKKVAVRLTGIDLNPFAARAAREAAQAGEQIRWVTGDAFSFDEGERIDIVISSLFTHHLADGEIRQFLQWMERRAERGWFINDLHRKPQPYLLFQVLAKAAGWHKFVQHDGPLSIRRSFDFQDWHELLAGAGIAGAQVEAFRPGRLCVGRVKHA